MCRPVHQEIDLAARPREVYDAYLDSARHARITGQQARMSRKEGGSFTAGDRYISGYNLELVAGRRIVQAWRASEWPPGAYSILRLELRPKGKGTRLVVDHLGIPDEFRDGVDSGWHEFYWEPMKAYFGEAPAPRTPARRPRPR
jgi:activator of HSP90 ATPase